MMRCFTVYWTCVNSHADGMANILSIYWALSQAGEQRKCSCKASLNLSF